MSPVKVPGVEDRVVLVTGARRGIGKACALAFAAAGATVAIGDLEIEALATTHTELENACGADHTAHAGDLGEAADCERIVAEVVAAHGRIDAVVNAAGMLITRPLLELEPAEWDRTLAVNARGSMLLSQAAARRMVEQGGGRIVLFASIVVNALTRLDNVAYSASKAAVLQTARCMALELARHNVTVNVVSPGSTATEMLLEDQLGGGPDVRETALQGDPERWRLGVPMGRLAEPSDQAAAAVFFVSDAARHVTGQELAVDGGQGLV